MDFIINTIGGTIKLITSPIKSILYIAALIVLIIIIYFRIKFYTNAVNLIDLILVDFYLCGHNVPVKGV